MGPVCEPIYIFGIGLQISVGEVFPRFSSYLRLAAKVYCLPLTEA